MYGSDKIDNVRHRSRVLMYVKDDSKSEKRETEAMGEKSTDIVTGKDYIHSSTVSSPLPG